MASIEREVELALLNAVSGASIPNSYTSERDASRLLPNVSAKASISNELLGPFTGVFTLSASLTYTSRADTISRAGFDHEVQTIIEELYSNPSLPSVMTTSSNLTVYNASITSEGGTVLARNRTWQRNITLEVKASASKAGGPPPPFSPTDLAGLKLWLKADFGVTLSGSNVTAWADQSGNGNNASSTEETPPIFIGNSINGLPVIEFNESQLITTISNDFGQTGFTVFFVVIPQNDATFNAFLGKDNGESGFGFIYRPTSNIGFSRNNQWAFQALNQNIIYGTPLLLTNIENVTGSNFVFVDGGEADAQAFGDIELPYNEYQNDIGIGTFIDGTTGHSKIAEIALYNRALTQTERQQVEAYLNTKYAIY